MSKMSSAGKMRIQMLHEQGYGGKGVVDAYPLNSWKLNRPTAKKIGQHVHQTRSTTERKADSGSTGIRASDTNITRVEKLICSHGVLAADQLSRFYDYQRQVAPPNSPDVKCIDYNIWGNV